MYLHPLHSLVETALAMDTQVETDIEMATDTRKSQPLFELFARSSSHGAEIVYAIESVGIAVGSAGGRHGDWQSFGVVECSTVSALMYV